MKTPTYDCAARLRALFKQEDEIDAAIAEARKDDAQYAKRETELRSTGRYKDAKVTTELASIGAIRSTIPFLIGKYEDMRPGMAEQVSYETTVLKYILDPLFLETGDTMIASLAKQLNGWFSDREEARTRAAAFFQNTLPGQALGHVYGKFKSTSNSVILTRGDAELVIMALDGLVRFLEKNAPLLPEDFHPLPADESARRKLVPEHLRPEVIQERARKAEEALRKQEEAIVRTPKPRPQEGGFRTQTPTEVSGFDEKARATTTL